MSLIFIGFWTFFVRRHFLRSTLRRRPTTAQDCSKRAPRGPQNGSLTAPRRPKTAQESPRRPKIVPRWLQDASTLPQDGPKTPQVGPKTPQERPREAPGRPKTAPGEAKKCLPFHLRLRTPFRVRFGGDSGPILGPFRVRFRGEFGPLSGFVGSAHDGPRTPPVGPKMVLLTTLH